MPAPIRPTTTVLSPLDLTGPPMYEAVRYLPMRPAPETPTSDAGVVDRTLTRDADRTQREILEVATTEFAEQGFAGGRVDEIAARTRTTKRMIYYYFGSKERLFVAVLERAYAGIRAKEQTIEVDHLDPVAAIRRVAELTFDHHESHPDFIPLVAIENVPRAEPLARLPTLEELGSPAIELIDAILARGRADGTFTRDA